MGALGQVQIADGCSYRPIFRNAAGDRGNKHEGHFSREEQGGPAYVLIRPIAFDRAQSARR